MKALLRGTMAAVGAAMLAAGCASAPPAAPPQTPAAAPATPAGSTLHPTPPGLGQFPYSDADVAFMSGMIPHHAQAVIMAGWAPSHGARHDVAVLCERIVVGQRDEITLMQNWLRDRGQPVPEAKPGPMRMTMNGMTHDMLMPGMLTDAQMKELDAARGAEFDRLFLRYMIQHHEGAVSMVNELFATPGAAQEQSVFKLASDVSVDQTTEIKRMQKMLATLLLDAGPR